MSSGNELVNASTIDLPPGKIRDSNKTMLYHLARQTGALTLDLGTVGDSGSQIDEAITQAVSDCDLLVTSGGVSMGELDLIKPYIELKG